MKMYDCDVCLSAGSVNQWGYCEICGEDFEDPESRVIWRHEFSSLTMDGVGELVSGPANDSFASVGQDAA